MNSKEVDSDTCQQAGEGGYSRVSSEQKQSGDELSSTLKRRVSTTAATDGSNLSDRQNGINEDTFQKPSVPLDDTFKERLVHRKDLPKHLQFNPYIDTGYRPLLSIWECFLSLFYLHNETVNIITHAIPMLYILVWWRSLIPWSDVSVPVLPWTHLVSIVSPWVGSTIYHLFMNHKSGEQCYKCLLQLDMFGIWITQSFGALTTVYASVFCLSTPWIWRYISIYCFICFWCLYKARRAKNPWDRRFCFTMPFLTRLASVCLRLSSSGGGHPGALKHVCLQDVVAVVGGFVGAMRIPEKWIPGKLDFLANSHHIMHIVVVYAVYHVHKGAVLDMLWLSSDSICSNGTIKEITSI